jgi:hypothetical protein
MSKLTGTFSEVAEYEFTTLTAVPGTAATDPRCVAAEGSKGADARSPGYH